MNAIIDQLVWWYVSCSTRNCLPGVIVCHSGENGCLAHLDHFGVEALSNFTAAMSHQDRAIGVDVGEGGGLSGIIIKPAGKTKRCPGQLRLPDERLASLSPAVTLEKRALIGGYRPPLEHPANFGATPVEQARRTCGPRATCGPQWICLWSSQYNGTSETF